MCASMDDCDGQGHLLSLILHGSHLFSTRRGDGSSAREAAQLRRPLNELIRDGAFVRHGEGAPVPGGSFAKYSPRDKRELALKLAFFLLDFFDSGITSDRIHMPVGPRPGRQRTHAAPFLSFGSSPLSEADQESYWNFDIGHPALVSFSKLLLELEWGRPIDLDISQDPYQNRETWSQLMMMLHDSEVDIDDCLYTDAIDGCLSSARPIAKALRKCGLEDRTRASSKVRQLLYDKVVSKLEAGLEKSIPRRRGSKRERSESPPPLSDSLKGPMPKITTTRMAHRHKDAGHSRGSSLPHSLSGLHDGTNGSRQSRSPLSHVSYPRPAGRDDFEVAIMCALDTEYNAVHRLLDVSWPDNVYGKEDADENVYTTGRMGSTNVVVVLMGMGKVPAACAATSLRFSYKNVRLALLVGICGAVPHDPKSDREILRGDVIVGKTIVQHDFGRLTEDGLITKTTVEDSLGRPNPKMRNLLSAIGTDEYMAHLRGRTAHFLADIQAAVACTDDCNKYHHPGHRQDTSLDDMARRPQSSISNGRSPADDGNPSPPSSSSSSSSPPYDQDGRTAPGPTRGRRQLGPTVHVGVYASGDSVVRSADARDRIAQKTNAIGFEMESAGIWDKLPCIVVKGVCDYADPEKDRIWQNFASATAASATKAIIERYHER